MTSSRLWSELDLGPRPVVTERVALFALTDEHLPALHCDLEVPDATLRAIETQPGAAQLIARVLQAGVQQLELRPLLLVELGAHAGHSPTPFDGSPGGGEPLVHSGYPARRRRKRT